MHELVFHVIHVGRNVREEAFISCTQVVETRFSVRCLTEAVFGALSITGKQKFAFFTHDREFVFFVGSEFHLHRTVHHFNEALFVNVAEFEFRKDEVVATVYIAIKFHHPCMAASFGHRAETGHDMHPVGQGRIE